MEPIYSNSCTESNGVLTRSVDDSSGWTNDSIRRTQSGDRSKLDVRSLHEAASSPSVLLSPSSTGYSDDFQATNTKLSASRASSSTEHVQRHSSPLYPDDYEATSAVGGSARSATSCLSCSAEFESAVESSPRDDSSADETSRSKTDELVEGSDGNYDTEPMR